LPIGVESTAMTDGSREAFLAGERPDDVFVYLADRAVSGIETLAEHGQRVNGGIVLVLDAERGRRVVNRATGTEAMDLASAAMDTEGEIDLDPEVAGACPAAAAAEPDPGSNPNTESADRSAVPGPGTSEGTHALQYVFAFAEERNEEVGGIYAEGDVIHAYAVCTCGTAYSDRWVANE
jgi:hypothetical protein